MKNKIFIVVFLFLTPLLRRGAGGEAIAQDTLPTSTQQKLENLAESSQNEEEDYTSLLETLEHYRAHPINLNNTNTAQLDELGLLSKIQIENLLSHIDQNGKLISIYELQSIDGFDKSTIEKILPFVKVTDITDEPHASLKEILKHGSNEITLRGQQTLEEQKGFSQIDSTGINNAPNSRYIGSPLKIYTRYRFTYRNNISVGFTAEKDPGELFFKSNNKFDYPHYDSLLQGKQTTGFDFYSAHLFLKNFGKIKALAIGDYQIGFGQGLTAWSGLAYGKSADAESIQKYSSGLRPYTSVDENRFMRGAALTCGSNTLQATAFFSKKKIDANVLNADSTLSITSLQQTGLHTTPSEIADKHSIDQTIVGGNISYHKRKYSFGLTGTNTTLGKELVPAPSSYNQFAFSGKQISNLGADYSFLIRNVSFFGEAALSSPFGTTVGWERSSREGVAFLNGCIISLDPRLTFSFLHRSYQRNYQSLYSNGFSEGTGTSNEQGFCYGITAKPTNSLSINAYYDHFTFPWLKYQVNAPSTGSEYLLQINYTPKKGLDTYIRVKQKDKFINSTSIDEIDFISPYKQVNYRWQIGYMASPSLKLSNRVEYIQIKKDAATEDGYLMYQDATYKKKGSKFSLTIRYALFDTKSYNSRIYSYENDITGTYSIPSYYNKGSRVYLLLNYNITRSIELWLRCSQTYYSNQSIISAGSLSEIDGHTKTEVKVQVRVRF